MTIARASSIIAGFLAGTSAQAQIIAPADDVARSFVPMVESFIATLPIETERFDIRVNRCSGQRGELSDQMFYVWIGWRGASTSGNVTAMLEDIHDAWEAREWTITRYRHLENGGVNIAATDTATGNGFALDSGFASGPDIFVVGTFNSPCHQHSPGPAPFGRWSGPPNNPGDSNSAAQSE